MENQNEHQNASAPGGYVYPTPLIMGIEKVGTSMRQSSPENQLQQEIQASEIAPETLQDVVYTRVDPYTLEIIQQIFPAPNKGLEFTARILRLAQIVQNSLPGLEDWGDHVAVINVRTIRTLAQSIDWGYDTTHKYIITFCALGLLHKTKQGNERQLIFPLQRYMPPINLQALDKLITNSRPKVQQFARQVKTRLLQLNATVLTPSASVNKFDESDIRFRDTIYQSLFNVIESEGIDPVTGRQLSKRIITEVLSRFDISRATIQTHERTYRQAATGTNNDRALAIPSTTSVQTSERPYEFTQYQTQSTQYPIESTQYSTKYAHYQAQSTQYSTKYAHYQAQSTPETAQSRLSETKVSAPGRLHNRVSARSRLVSFEITPTVTLGETQVDWSRFATPKVSSQRLEEDTRAKQRTTEQPAVSLYETYTSPNKISSLEILKCYENVLHNNQVDWEADGLSTEFIEKLYQELYAVYTSFNEKKLIGTSQGFFFKTLEKRFINRFATECQLDFISVYNLIMFRTNREQFMLAEEQQPADTQATAYIEDNQQQPDYSNNNYSRIHSVDPREDEYQYPVDQRQDEYQRPVDPREDEYQYPVDSREDEYQYPVDLREDEYQRPVDLREDESTERQPLVDSRHKKYRQQVDSTPQKSTPAEDTQRAGVNARERKPTHRHTRAKNVSITDIIEKSILDEGKSYLRIPQTLDAQKYSSDFLNVYVTSNINLLFKNIYNNTTLRNDAKMFFAETFDTNRSTTAKNWYSKLFSKCNNAESLLAAFIETILDLHSRGNKTIKNPGGLFNKKCAEYEKTISDSAREHIKTYGQLPYEEFVLEIARFAQHEHNNKR